VGSLSTTTKKTCSEGTVDEKEEEGSSQELQVKFNQNCYCDALKIKRRKDPPKNCRWNSIKIVIAML
jgi:hypothetical protein